MRIRCVTTVAFLLAVAAQPSQAQQWNVDAQVGRVRASLDAAAPVSQTAVLGLRYDHFHRSFRVSAGVPLPDAGFVWGSVSGWNRFSLRRSGFLAGLDVAGNAFALQDRATVEPQPIPPLGGAPAPERQSGSAFALQALPLLGFEWRDFQLLARAGVSHYSAQFSGPRSSRTVQLGDLQLTYMPLPGVMLAPTVRRYQARDEDPATFAGLTAVFAQERVTVWGSAGQWLDIEADERTAWGAGASLRVLPRASLIASANRDVFDPLLLSEPQTSWNVGVSLHVAGRIGPPPPPVPAAYSNGIATVRLPVKAARSAPSIAGDFNGWKPERMRRVGGDWVYAAPMAPGVYHYAFVDDDGNWFVPENVPGRKDDGMGGHVAVLVVR